MIPSMAMFKQLIEQFAACTGYEPDYDCTKCPFNKMLAYKGDYECGDVSVCEAMQTLIAKEADV
jgi:hypothetical protein